MSKSVADAIQEELGLLVQPVKDGLNKVALDWSQIGSPESSVSTAKDLLVKEIEQMIVDGDEPKERKSLHMSDVLNKNFCYRKCVLAACEYPQNKVNLSADRIKAYSQGWAMHERWQAWAAKAGKSKGSEVQRLVKNWWLVFTPDDVWELDEGINRVVEIKGYDHTEVARILKSNKPPRDALVQVNCYCYLLGIPDWLILVESKGKIIDEDSSKKKTEEKSKLSIEFRKGTQEFFVWTGKYDPELVKPYIVRLNTIKVMVDAHIANGALHPGICDNPNEYIAQECSYRDICFASAQERQAARTAR